MVDIKICGLRTLDALDAALDRGASHVGFVSFEKSPRHLPLAEMAALRARAGTRALATVVTVDPTDDLLDELTAAMRPDWIQLHGRETPDRVRAIAARTGARVMKAISVACADDLAAMEAYRNVADRLLLDAKRPKGSELPGGNGVAFDWRILGALDRNADYMLSGGLNAGNIGEALRLGRPGGLDISSGVESAPGVKDPRLIHAFFDAVDALGRDQRQGRVPQ